MRKELPVGWLADFFEISLERANQFYTWGWRLSAIGAAITVVGVALLWWGTRIRDHDFEQNIANLHNRAARFEKEAADARERSIMLERNLERERIERLKLEEKQKPRRITPQQRATLLACLASVAKGPVTVVPKTFDTEAEQYAAQLTEVLREAKFEIRSPTGPRPFGFGMTGVFAVFNDANNPPPHAAEIQHCLSQIGVELSGGANPDWVKDPQLVIIAVSQKP
jgi:hypothetical protein